MKNLFYFFLASLLVSCGKDTTTLLNCKLSKIIRVNGPNSDTSYLTYSGENLNLRYAYSYTPTVYVYDYIKSGSQYIYTRYTDGVQSLDGFYSLNAQGLFDTSKIIHLPSMALNNTAKNKYNSDGRIIHAMTYYGTYQNDIDYNYNSDGNYTYWIYEQQNFTVPANSTKDSIVFEYYLSKLKLTEKYPFESKNGKLEKNLIKRMYWYNLLSSKELRKTYDYEYITDANGFVTRQVFTAKNQPGDIVTSTDTTYYEYICN